MRAAKVRCASTEQDCAKSHPSYGSRCPPIPPAAARGAALRIRRNKRKTFLARTATVPGPVDATDLLIEHVLPLGSWLEWEDAQSHLASHLYMDLASNLVLPGDQAFPFDLSVYARLRARIMLADAAELGLLWRLRVPESSARPGSASVARRLVIFVRHLRDVALPAHATWPQRG